MPGQRRAAGPRARGSWLPRLTGIGVILLLAAGGATAYVVTQHVVAGHHAPPLPTRVVSYQTVGLVAASADSADATGQLLQLLGPHGMPEFSPVGQAQEAQGSPQWTADLMAGGSYIFIFLPTGDCLSATGKGSHAKLALRHCDLSAAQRWQRTQGTVLTQGHDFYQYANLGYRSCLTQTGVLPGQLFGADLAACSAAKPADQLIAFWWSSV